MSSIQRKHLFGSVISFWWRRVVFVTSILTLSQKGQLRLWVLKAYIFLPSSTILHVYWDPDIFNKRVVPHLQHTTSFFSGQSVGLTRINHGLPGLLLAVFDLDHEIVQLCLHSSHITLQPSLLDGEKAVGVGHLSDGLPNVGYLSLDAAASTLSRVQ